MLPLETSRLILRSFGDADLEPFLAYRSDPDVARYQGWNLPYTPDQAAALIADMKTMREPVPGRWLQIAVERKEAPGLIGDVACKLDARDPRQAEIGFTLARAHQGQGYAAEAVGRLLDDLFGRLRLHRVTAVCDVENEASVRLLERLGMRREGHFVENIWFKGAWESEYLYAVLRWEWPAGR